MVLARILARKREEVLSRKASCPADALLDGLRPSDRSLEEALRRPHQSYILECKRSSPSRGPICPGRDAVEIVRDYIPFADAISVLTDGPDFGGSHEDLRRVRASLHQPVICKDFVLEPYQVREARAYGADAVLLMLSVLDDEAFRACHSEAQRWSLDALVEVHDGAELDRALALGARIIGINNRDLKTLKIDLGTTERLAGRVAGRAVVVAESGLLDHRDARRLRPYADAFLVGTGLQLRGEAAIATRALIHGHSKVCGLTRPGDAADAFALGATHGGLIFAPGSSRSLGIEQAATVMAGAPVLRWVGVFVNEDAARVQEAAIGLGLSAVQLHGEEDRGFIDGLRSALPESCEIWRSLSMRPGLRIPAAAELGVARIVLDTYDPARRGGTGRRFDWSQVAERSPEERAAWILAGGIGPENAAEADALGMFALDASSGLESAPGIKSRETMGRMFAALRG